MQTVDTYSDEIQSDYKLILPHKKYNIAAKRRISYEDVTPRSYKTLPINVLVKIFHNVPIDDVIKRVSMVCKHWRYAAMHEEFIKSFYIYGPDCSLPYIYDHLRKYKKVHALYIEKVPNPSVILLQAEKIKLNLRKLSFKNCKNLDGNLLKYILLKFPNLTAFEIVNTCFINETMKYSVIAELKSLRKLNISNIKNITMRDLLQTILNCPFLEELTIGLLPSGVDLRDDDAILIITNLAPQLRYLSIDSHTLTSRTFEKLIECPHLESLFINYGVNFSGAFLMDVLHCVPKLVKFGITRNCIVTGNDVRNIFTSGSTDFSDITHLDFTYCVLLNDVGIETIADSCKNLRSLLLKSCRSVRNIDRLTQNCSDLKDLNIAFCTRLKIPFFVPYGLEKLTLHEHENLSLLVDMLGIGKSVILYKAISEYNDEIIRM